MSHGSLASPTCCELPLLWLNRIFRMSRRCSGHLLVMVKTWFFSELPICSTFGPSSRRQAPVRSESLPVICDLVRDAKGGKLSDESSGICRQYTHKHCTYSAAQSLHKRGMHRTRLAQELHDIFVRLKRFCHLVRTCLTLCCSLSCRSPRAHHLPHSIFLLPRHQSTHYNRDNTIYSKNTQYIINLSKTSQSTSGAIKNHSCVKTCRVAETRAKHSPQYQESRGSGTRCCANSSASRCHRGGRRVQRRKRANADTEIHTGGFWTTTLLFAHDDRSVEVAEWNV